MPSLIVSSVSERSGRTAISAGLASILSEKLGRILIADTSAGQPETEKHSYAGLSFEENVLLNVTQNSAQEAAQAILSEFKGAAVAVVEGRAGDEQFNLTLAETLDGLIIIVASNEEDISAARKAYGSRFAGMILNNIPQYRMRTAAAEVNDVVCFGSLPQDRRLNAPTLNQINERLQGRYLTWEEHGERLAEHFLIGGMILDWGPYYFNSRKNNAVVVRGDRPDVQLSALQSEEVAGLVITAGITPVEYVVYESKQKQKPMILADGDTMEVCDNLAELYSESTFAHPQKLSRMRELLKEHADMEAIERLTTAPATR